MQQLKTKAATTHFPTPMAENGLTHKQKIEQIATHFSHIMQALGLDLTDESLKDTPMRVAKMYVEEIFYGLDMQNFPKVTAVNDSFYQTSGNMILIKDITLQSMCEHHFVPMIGKASVAYISNGKVLGLSKINRIVEFFSKRPQLQERLTAQIADCLSILLGTEDVAVALSAKHYCVSMRGVQDTSSVTITHILNGKFKSDPALHSEFLESTLTK